MNREFLSTLFSFGFQNTSSWTLPFTQNIGRVFCEESYQLRGKTQKWWLQEVHLDHSLYKEVQKQPIYMLKPSCSFLDLHSVWNYLWLTTDIRGKVCDAHEKDQTNGGKRGKQLGINKQCKERGTPPPRKLSISSAIKGSFSIHETRTDALKETFW